LVLLEGSAAFPFMYGGNLNLELEYSSYCKFDATKFIFLETDLLFNFSPSDGAHMRNEKKYR